MINIFINLVAVFNVLTITHCEIDLCDFIHDDGKVALNFVNVVWLIKLTEDFSITLNFAVYCIVF